MTGISIRLNESLTRFAAGYLAPDINITEEGSVASLSGSSLHVGRRGRTAGELGKKKYILKKLLM